MGHCMESLERVHVKLCYNKNMTDEELIKITDSMQEKLGDNSAVIADDIGLLITGNTNSQKALQERDAEIERLKATNEKLVLANGNLLKQIPVEKANTKRSDEDASEVKTIKLSDAFDANGNFKH